MPAWTSPRSVPGQSSLASPAGGERTPVAVLLVDDNPANLVALEAVLAPLGERLVRAGSGQEALAVAEREAFAVVLLDVRMPGLDGLATAQAIRQQDARHEGRPATPIIFLTAGDVTDRAQTSSAYALGAVDYLGKPLDPDALRAKVQVFIELARTREQAIRQAARAAAERAAAEAVRESEARYRFLAETMPILVWTATPDGLVDYASEQAVGYTGRTASELLGDRWFDALHRDDAPRAAVQWRRALDTGDDYEVEFRLWSAVHGAYRWQLGRAVARRDAAGRIVAWVGTNTDVEDQKRATERMARLQALSAALAEAATTAAVVHAVVTQGVAAVDAAAGLLVQLMPDGETLELVEARGYPPALVELWTHFPLSAPVPLAESVRNGATVVFVSAEASAERYPALWGTATPHRISVSVPLVTEGRAFGALGVSFDEARSLDAEDEAFLMAVARQCAIALERARLYDAEQRARAAAEAANAAKSQFLSTMSHELRTPLNAIGGYVDLLDMELRGPVTEAQREDFARIRRSAAYLLGLINDVLNVARLEAGQVEFRLEDVRLDLVLADLQALVEPQVRAKRLAFSHHVHGDGLVLRADPERLKQILLNLLTNAIKFTDASGCIAIAGVEDGTSVRLRVSDTGRGIAADQLGRIFEPFVQVDRHLTQASQQGVGLGLAISRELARRMGGDLTAESEVGKGSTFTLTLPRATG